MNSDQLNFKLFNRASNIDGLGCFSAEKIPAKKKIGNLGGEIISMREARKRLKKQQKLAMVEFGNGLALDASVYPNALRYVNHSCAGNSFMRCRYGRVEFYAKRNIKSGEEITCDYGETHHEGKRVCTCGAENCKGNI
jgi:uncharacterized protein